MAVNKLDPKVIFASTAPTQDTPAVFPNKTNGWGESRKNGGRPTIKQMNALQQETDLKLLWLNENAVTPYDATIDYPNNAVVIKDNTFKILDAGVWKDFVSRDVVSKLKTIPTYYSADEGVNAVTGVGNGAYYNVRSTEDDGFLIEYQNIGGVPTPSGKSYPSSAALSQVVNDVAEVKEALIDPDTGKVTARKVFDASGENQQLLNTGLTTVSQLSQISSPYDGMRMRVKSVVEPNYALARPYVGAGEFFYASAKSSVNDGGVVINGWVRIFDGAVKPEWWGADPTGATNSTSAMQSAINYCRNNPVRPMGASRGGMGSIELDGVYVWDGEIDLKQVNGLTIRAKSKFTTTVIHTTNAGYMFNMQRYLNVNFEDIAFFAGTYNISTDKEVTLFAEQGTTAFNLSGQGGGKQLNFTRCEFRGFKCVYRTLDDLINCDTFTANKCNYSFCDTVWENSNPNAVIWAFNDCGFYAYKELFINPANTLRVTGGQAIGETFWKGLSTSNALNSYLLFSGIRFESYINAVPSAKPLWLDIDCPTTGVVFENCPMYGLPAGGIASVETGKIRFSAYGDIKFKNCQVRGYFTVVSAYAASGITSRLTFEDCEETPAVNQTYESNSNNRYINLIYKNHWLTKTSRINRNFLTMFNGGGAGGGVSTANGGDPMVDVFSYASTRTASTTAGRTLPIWCPDPYKLNISKFEFSFAKGVTANGFDIAIYRDSTKALKIAEMLNVGVGKMNGTFEIESKDFLVSQEVNSSSVSTPIYIEVVNTSSLGILNLDTHVHLIQQAHSN